MKNKVVLITGASSGIGAVCGIELSKLGYHVLINHLKEEIENAINVKKMIENIGRDVTLIEGDVSIESDVNLMSNFIDRTFDGIDYLINNAGIYPRVDWNNLDYTFWNKMLQNNLSSHFLCIHILTKKMIKNKAGSIVNIGSILSKVGRKDLLPYTAAKAGLEGLTLSTAIELGKYNITCNCILPGSIKVERETQVVMNLQEMENRQLEKQCIKRRGIPIDVANLVKFLISDESNFITGQSICVDGGWFFNRK